MVVDIYFLLLLYEVIDNPVLVKGIHFFTEKKRVT